MLAGTQKNEQVRTTCVKARVWAVEVRCGERGRFHQMTETKPSKREALAFGRAIVEARTSIPGGKDVRWDRTTTVGLLQEAQALKSIPNRK